MIEHFNITGIPESSCPYDILFSILNDINTIIKHSLWTFFYIERYKNKNWSIILTPDEEKYFGIFPSNLLQKGICVYVLPKLE